MLDFAFRIRIIVDRPPPNAHFALQLGKADLAPPLARDADSITFEVVVRAVHNRAGALDFRGPAVQGPVGSRFVYINSGSYAGDATNSWNRRAKVSLQGITTAHVDALMVRPALRMEGQIHGTARDGGPVAASTPLLGAGWRLVDAGASL